MYTLNFMPSLNVKSLLKTLVLIWTMFSVETFAETITYNTSRDWSSWTKIKMSDKDKHLYCSGTSTFFTGNKKIKISPDKVYSIQASARAVNIQNEKKAKTAVGFRPLTANNRTIFMENASIVANGLTTLISDARKGDKQIILKRNPKMVFKPNIMALVKDAKADLSDLPNFNVLAVSLKSLQTSKDGKWILTLKNPLAADVKAGTSVRFHNYGVYMNTGGISNVGQEWITFRGSVQGISSNGGYSPVIWPAGTVYAIPYIFHNRNNSPSAVEYQDVTVTISDKEKKPAGFRVAYTPDISQIALIPQGVMGFFNPNEKVKFKFYVKSNASLLEYSLSVKDEYGHVVFSSPRKKLENEIILPGQTEGYYIVESEIFANGKKAYYLQSAFAVNCPFIKRDPFFQFGIGAVPQFAEGFKRVGCGSIALKFADFYCNPPSNKEALRIFFHQYDGFLKNDDFTYSCVIASRPRNTSVLRTQKELREGWPILSDAQFKSLMDAVDVLLNKIGKKVKIWGIQCEIPSAAQSEHSSWTETMFNHFITARMVSRKIKKYDPNIKVFFGGNNVQACTDTVERIICSDLVKDFDRYAIDGYSGNWDMTLGGHFIPEAGVKDFYRAASDLSESLGKGKIIRNEETGYAIHYGAPFDHGLAIEQAELTARLIIITKAGPVENYELHMPTFFWWQKPKNDSVLCMSTVWKPFRFDKELFQIPLPGGAMYATSAKELSFSKFHSEIILGTVHCCIFTKPDGNTVAAIWNLSGYKPFGLQLPAHAKVINMYGRDITKMPLAIGTAPIFITFKEPAKNIVPIMQKAIAREMPRFKSLAVPGKVFLRSMLNRRTDVKLQFAGIPEQKITVPPNKLTLLALPVSGPGILKDDQNRHYKIPFIKEPVCVIGRSENATESSGILKYPEHIRPVEALQAERRYFKTDRFNPNGHNISAKYEITHDDRYFHLKVVVDDPKHLQQHTGLNIWKGDSIQFTFATKEGMPESMRFSNEKADSSDHTYGLALTSQGTQLVKYYGKDAGFKNYPAKVERIQGKTHYNVSIPLNVLGGKICRFGFVVFNTDSPTEKTPPYWLEFSPGIAGGHDISKLKPVIFTK